MSNITRKSILIFLTFFIVFSLFAQWNDHWDYGLYLSPTRSMTLENRLEINSYKNVSPQVFYINGDYYSPQSLGHSIISIPAYRTGLRVYSFIPENLLVEDEIDIYYEQDYRNSKLSYEKNSKISFIRFFVIIFTVSIMGSLSVLLFYKILRFFSENESNRFILTFAFGLGTLVLPYSTTFHPRIPSLFLLLLTFYLVLYLKEKSNQKYYILPGILAGFSTGIFELSLVLIFFISLYVAYDDLKKFLYFILGISIGYLPYIIYSVLVTDMSRLPLIGRILTAFFLDFIGETGTFLAPNFVFSHEMIGFYNPSIIPIIILRLLFGLYRGIFFYNPILILFPFGIYYMYKAGKKSEAVIFVFMFLSIPIFIALSFGWWGLFSFGQRNFVLLMPFMTIPVIYCFKNINKKIIVFLIILSISINFLGFQGWESKSDEQIKERVTSFESVGNPLFDRYIPLTLRNGPRSILLENLLINREINVFNSPQIRKNYDYLDQYEVPIYRFSDKLLTLRIPFLSVFILFLILFAIWSKHILAKFYFIRENIILILLLILVIFFVFFVRIRTNFVGSGWLRDKNNYYVNDLNRERIMEQNGTLYYYSEYGNENKIKLEYESLINNNSLNVFVNGRKSNIIETNKSIRDKGSLEVDLDEGINEIVFNSENKCKRNTDFLGSACVSYRINVLKIS